MLWSCCVHTMKSWSTIHSSPLHPQWSPGMSSWRRRSPAGHRVALSLRCHQLLPEDMMCILQNRVANEIARMSKHITEVHNWDSLSTKTDLFRWKTKLCPHDQKRKQPSESHATSTCIPRMLCVSSSVKFNAMPYEHYAMLCWSVDWRKLSEASATCWETGTCDGSSGAQLISQQQQQPTAHHSSSPSSSQPFTNHHCHHQKQPYLTTKCSDLFTFHLIIPATIKCYTEWGNQPISKDSGRDATIY